MRPPPIRKLESPLPATSAVVVGQVEGAAHRAVYDQRQIVHQLRGDLRGYPRSVGSQNRGVRLDFDGLLRGAHFHHHVQPHGRPRGHHNVVFNLRLEAGVLHAHAITAYRQPRHGEISRCGRAGFVTRVGNQVNRRHYRVGHSRSTRILHGAGDNPAIALCPEPCGGQSKKHANCTHDAFHDRTLPVELPEQLPCCGSIIYPLSIEGRSKCQRRRIGCPAFCLLRWAASINAMISSVSSGATGGVPVWKNLTICCSNGP